MKSTGISIWSIRKETWILFRFNPSQRKIRVIDSSETG